MLRVLEIAQCTAGDGERCTPTKSSKESEGDLRSDIGRQRSSYLPAREEAHRGNVDGKSTKELRQRASDERAEAETYLEDCRPAEDLHDLCNSQVPSCFLLYSRVDTGSRCDCKIDQDEKDETPQTSTHRPITRVLRVAQLSPANNIGGCSILVDLLLDPLELAAFVDVLRIWGRVSRIGRAIYFLLSSRLPSCFCTSRFSVRF